MLLAEGYSEAVFIVMEANLHLLPPWSGEVFTRSTRLNGSYARNTDEVYRYR